METESNDDVQSDTEVGTGDDRDRRAARRWRLPLFALGAIGFGVALYFALYSGRGTVSTDNAYVRSSKIQISAEIEGRVTELGVNDNQFVRKGQLLFRVDPAEYEIERARLAAKREEVAALILTKKERYREKAIALERARTTQLYAVRELERQERLAEQNVVSASKLDDAREERETSEQTVQSIRQEMAALAADLAGEPDGAVEDHPSYLAVLAELERADLDLARTVVRSPTTGIISQLADFRPGTYVNANRPLFAIVETDNVWVEANLKETQLKKVRIGQSVEVEVDAYPGTVITGRVESFSPATGAEFAIIPPQNASGKWVKITQRLPVFISIDEGGERLALMSGLSAEVRIDVTGEGERPHIQSIDHRTAQQSKQ